MDVKITGNVKHNGKHYEPGDVLKKVNEVDAERLINLGVAEKVESKGAKSNDDAVDTPSDQIK